MYLLLFGVYVCCMCVDLSTFRGMVGYCTSDLCQSFRQLSVLHVLIIRIQNTLHADKTLGTADYTPGSGLRDAVKIWPCCQSASLKLELEDGGRVWIKAGQSGGLLTPQKPKQKEVLGEVLIKHQQTHIEAADDPHTSFESILYFGLRVCFCQLCYYLISI